MECGREASTSTNIKILLFLVLAFMVSFTLQQVKTKYRSGITQAQGYLPHLSGYVWPMKTLDADYVAPKQFGRFG